MPPRCAAMKKRSNVVTISAREARLRRKIREHLHGLGFTKNSTGLLVPPSLDKAGYRLLHEPQRQERLDCESEFLDRASSELIEHFANGDEIDVDRMRVRLELIDQQCWQSDLFRFASLLWSVPVSHGFGRRMRYLVWDDHSKKLVGLFALGDPVFNLRARDTWIGWSAAERTDRLVYMLDGYVIGAVPPFNSLLGGKLVATLLRTKEIVADFRERYGSSRGLISRKAKNAHLVAITTTSALGRSSVYNRLRLGGIDYLEPLGFTGGFGHFHFPAELFDQMRTYLKIRKHAYANSHQFGDGPNWRMRTIRQALRMLDMDPDLVRHGLSREVFVSSLADNAVEVLSGKRKRPKYDTLKSTADVAQLAIDRWIKPRALRDESYRTVRRSETLERILSGAASKGAALSKAARARSG
jgi:hypothetical protein